MSFFETGCVKIKVTTYNTECTTIRWACRTDSMVIETSDVIYVTAITCPVDCTTVISSNIASEIGIKQFTVFSSNIYCSTVIHTVIWNKVRHVDYSITACNINRTCIICKTVIKCIVIHICIITHDINRTTRTVISCMCTKECGICNVYIITCHINWTTMTRDAFSPSSISEFNVNRNHGIISSNINSTTITITSSIRNNIGRRIHHTGTNNMSIITLNINNTSCSRIGPDKWRIENISPITLNINSTTFTIGWLSNRKLRIHNISIITSNINSTTITTIFRNSYEESGICNIRIITSNINSTTITRLIFSTCSISKSKVRRNNCIITCNINSTTITITSSIRDNIRRRIHHTGTNNMSIITLNINNTSCSRIGPDKWRIENISPITLNINSTTFTIGWLSNRKLRIHNISIITSNINSTTITTIFRNTNREWWIRDIGIVSCHINSTTIMRSIS